MSILLKTPLPYCYRLFFAFSFSRSSSSSSSLLLSLMLSDRSRLRLSLFDYFWDLKDTFCSDCPALPEGPVDSDCDISRFIMIIIKSIFLSWVLTVFYSSSTISAMSMTSFLTIRLLLNISCSVYSWATIIDFLLHLKSSSCFISFRYASFISMYNFCSRSSSWEILCYFFFDWGVREFLRDSPAPAVLFFPFLFLENRASPP